MAVDGVPEKRATRRRGQTRARLLDAAFQVFAARGFGHSSIEQVCAAAGFSRGAFYSNFAGLDELFFALYTDRARLIAAQVAGALGAVGPAIPLATIVDRVTGTLLLDRDWLLVKTDFLLYAARHPAVAGVLAAHRDELRASIELLLRQFAGARALPFLHDDAGTAARAVIAAYDGVATQLILDGDTAGARAWLQHLLTTLLGDLAGSRHPTRKV